MKVKNPVKPDEKEEFISRVFTRAMHTNVLAYIIVNARASVINSVSNGTIKEPDTEEWIGDWAAYIAPVKGECHAEEIKDASKNGSRISYSVASALFGHLIDNLEGSGIGFRR